MSGAAALCKLQYAYKITDSREAILEQFLLRNVFLPHEMKRRNGLLANNTHLIHYTSAASAVSILRNKKVWMRNLRCMNDFMEVEHGFQLLKRYFSQLANNTADGGLEAIGTVLDSIFPDLTLECRKLFDEWYFGLRNKTYITCLSEHDASEQDYGRLSMWRAYTANQVGVGIVINPAPLYSLSDKFGAFSSPVHYYSDCDLQELFKEISSNILSSKQLIERQTRETIKGWFFLLLRVVAMCTKHPGFSEEREWRIIHTERLDDVGVLELDVECVNGIPQPVYKIPLEHNSNGGISGVSIPELINRIIIGPTQFPIAVGDAIGIELNRSGVSDALARIYYSEIPIRT